MSSARMLEIRIVQLNDNDRLEVVDGGATSQFAAPVQFFSGAASSPLHPIT